LTEDDTLKLAAQLGIIIFVHPIANNINAAILSTKQITPREETAQNSFDFRTLSNFFQSCGIPENVAKEYENHFIEKDIDFSKLKNLDLAQLRALGVKLGHCLKLLKAIREMNKANN